MLQVAHRPSCRFGSPRARRMSPCPPDCGRGRAPILCVARWCAAGACFGRASARACAPVRTRGAAASHWPKTSPTALGVVRKGRAGGAPRRRAAVAAGARRRPRAGRLQRQHGADGRVQGRCRRRRGRPLQRGGQRQWRQPDENDGPHVCRRGRQRGASSAGGERYGSGWGVEVGYITRICPSFFVADLGGGFLFCVALGGELPAGILYRSLWRRPWCLLSSFSPLGRSPPIGFSFSLHFSLWGLACLLGWADRLARGHGPVSHSRVSLPPLPLSTPFGGRTWSSCCCRGAPTPRRGTRAGGRRPCWRVR